MKTIVNKLYDIKIEANNGLIKITPLNDDAKQWIRTVVLKPSGLSRRLDFECVHVQVSELERILRKMMSSGFQVNMVRK